jgi:predicted permease
MEAGANPAMVGSTLVVSGRVCTVVGVTPPSFTGTMAVTAPPLWVPLGQKAGGPSSRPPADRLADRRNHTYGVVGRLANGVTLESAAPGLEVVSRAMEQGYPAENRNQSLEIRPAPRIGDSGSPRESDPFAMVMAFVLAMATALLLVAALNLANMLLARGSLRQREIAVRLAVGADRWSIVRQLLAEASLLSLAGGVLGLWVACGASRLVASTLLPLLPMFAIVFDPTPDVRVVAATLAAAVLGTVVFGLGPALKLSRADVVTGLKEQPGVTPARSGVGRAVVRHGLVVAQVALSLTLLTTGGLFFSGAVRASTADPGFSLDRGVLATVDGTLAGYDAPRRRTAYLRVLERLRALNGVAAASLASTIPYGESSNDQRVQSAGARPGDVAVSSIYRVVGADYFRTLGVPLVAGREFTTLEEGAATPVRHVIIDAELARRLWPRESPLGRQIQWAQAEAGGPAPEPREVVGVVGSIKSSLFDLASRPHVYVPFGGSAEGTMTLHVRTAAAAGGEKAMLASVAAEIRAADSALPVVALKTLRQHRDTGFEVWFVRLAAEVFTVFGVVAVAVAMAGVYGVRAITVGRRRREFGIRMAIGASTGDVMRLVVTEGARLVAVGLCAGLALSVGVSRMLAGWIYGVRTFEPAIFAITSALLVIAMLVACYLPARRATAVPPVIALRDQ